MLPNALSNNAHNVNTSDERVVIGNDGANLLLEPCAGEREGLGVEEADPKRVVLLCLLGRHWGAPGHFSGGHNLLNCLTCHPLHLGVLQIVEVPAFRRQSAAPVNHQPRTLAQQREK